MRGRSHAASVLERLPRVVLTSSLSWGFLLALGFAVVLDLFGSSKNKVFWTPEVFAGLVGALPAVLIALVVETRSADRDGLDWDSVLAAFVLLVGVLAALAATTTC